jgi:hypothetical protein
LFDFPEYFAGLGKKGFVEVAFGIKLQHGVVEE